MASTASTTAELASRERDSAPASTGVRSGGGGGGASAHGGTANDDVDTKSVAWSLVLFSHVLRFHKERPLIALTLLVALATFDVVGDVMFLTSVPDIRKCTDETHVLSYGYSSPFCNAEPCFWTPSNSINVSSTCFEAALYPTNITAEAAVDGAIVDLVGRGQCQAPYVARYARLLRDTSACIASGDIVFRCVSSIANSNAYQQDEQYVLVPEHQMVTRPYMYRVNGNLVNISVRYAECDSVGRRVDPSDLYSRDTGGERIILLASTTPRTLKNLERNAQGMSTLAYYLLIAVCVKEALKAVLALSTLFCPVLIKPERMAYFLNSPLVLLLLLSPAHRPFLAKTMQSNHGAAPWAIFVDLVVEDGPQLVIPLWLLHVGGSEQASAVTIVSLIGSLAMVTVNLARFCVGAQNQLTNQRRLLGTLAVGLTSVNTIGTGVTTHVSDGAGEASAADDRETDRLIGRVTERMERLEIRLNAALGSLQARVAALEHEWKPDARAFQH